MNRDWNLKKLYLVFILITIYPFVITKACVYISRVNFEEKKMEGMETSDRPSVLNFWRHRALHSRHKYQTYRWYRSPHEKKRQEKKPEIVLANPRKMQRAGIPLSKEKKNMQILFAVLVRRKSMDVVHRP